jgi:ATP/maltotriose-dependent transcriptional regulator MalT
MTVETSQPIEPLTLREAEIMLLLLDPWRDLSDIARELSISRATVGNHTISIYQKLGVCDRQQAVVTYARINRDYLRELVFMLKGGSDE